MTVVDPAPVADAQDDRRLLTIAVVGNFPPPVNGQALALAGTADRLAEAGHQVTRHVVTKRVPPPSARAVTRAARGLGSNVGYAGRLLRHAGRVLVARRVAEVTVIAMPANGGRWFVPAVVAACRVRGSRVVFRHDTSGAARRRLPTVAAMVALAGRDQLHVVLCDRMAAGLRARYGERLPTVTLSNAWLAEPSVARPAGRDAGPVRLGHLSNLDVAKGVLTVLDVFDELQRRQPGGYRLEVAGPTGDPVVRRALADAAARHGDAFTYCGAVYGSAKQDFWRRCDVFVFPSAYRQEAEPLVMDEALAAGVHVVASAVGCLGCSQTFPPGPAIEIAEEVSVAELTDRIERVATRLDPAACVASFDRRRARAESQWNDVLAAIEGERARPAEPVDAR